MPFNVGGATRIPVRVASPTPPVRGEASSSLVIFVPTLTARQVSSNPSVVVYSTALMTLPGNYKLSAHGAPAPISTLDVTLPSLQLRAYGGASARIELPALRLTASGTVPNIGRLQADLPSLRLTASGTTGGIAVAQLTLPAPYSLSARSGAQARLTPAYHYSLTASGVGGGVAHVEATLPSLRLVASVTSESVARAEMTLPALKMAPSGQAWLVGPSLSLHAVGHEVVSVTYEAYAINLTTGAVTHYTSYPFDNILRFGKDFFGVAPGGLYKIGGTLDVTQPIDAHIKTFATKLGSPKMKRVPYVYSSGRSNGGIRLGVTADEGETYEYESDWGEVAGSTNHRTKVGNGIRGAYFTFDISNIDGSSLELDSLDVTVAQSERAI